MLKALFPGHLSKDSNCTDKLNISFYINADFYVVLASSGM